MKHKLVHTWILTAWWGSGTSSVVGQSVVGASSAGEPTPRGVLHVLRAPSHVPSSADAAAR